MEIITLYDVAVVREIEITSQSVFEEDDCLPHETRTEKETTRELLTLSELMQVLQEADGLWLKIEVLGTITKNYYSEDEIDNREEEIKELKDKLDNAWNYIDNIEEHLSDLRNAIDNVSYEADEIEEDVQNAKDECDHD